MARKVSKYIYRAVALLLVATMLTTSITPLSYATDSNMDGETYCGIKAHRHTEYLCYEETTVLSCGIEEGTVHEHNEQCWAENPVLQCTKDSGYVTTGSSLEYSSASELLEDIGSTLGIHEHTEDCYVIEPELICMASTSEPHRHNDNCYTNELMLMCEFEEHEHTEACYKKLELHQQTLVTTGSSISISGMLPKGAKLIANPVDDNLVKQIEETHKEVLFGYDISIQVDGNDYQPEEPVQVTVSNVTVKENQPLSVWHVTQAADGIIEAVDFLPEDDVTIDKENSEISFMTSHFSTYLGVTEKLATLAENTVYFDLSAGDVTINGKNYKGYRYDGHDTPQLVEGTIKDTEAESYYVYQSDDVKNTGYITVDGEEVLTLPRRDRVDGWADFITNNTNVIDVIDTWINSSGRTATPYCIAVSGQVNATLTIEDLYSSHQTNSVSRTDGGISFVPSSASKLVIQYKGDNRFGNIFYSASASNGSQIHFNGDNDATLTVANISHAKNGAGHTSNYWNAAIGGNDGGKDDARGVVINSGILYAGTTVEDDCTAIGAGGNGYGEITINGGTVTAIANSSGTAIGGGIGKTSTGGAATVNITGGDIYAYNFSCTDGGHSETGVKYIPSAAIGGGSSARAVCADSTVNITGGTVYAQSVGGTAIGGGSSADNNGGTATINIGGEAVVYAKSIAGQIGGQNVPAGAAIGGGTGGKGLTNSTGNVSKVGNGGNAIINISGNAKVYTGSMGGGKTISEHGGKIGHAVFTIKDNCEIQGQAIMAAGANENCEFTMSGGTWTDNTDKTYDEYDKDTTKYVYLQPNGGAVWMDDDAGGATLNGGTIQGCNAENGGAVYMTAGTFTISGTAAIQNCTATGNTETGTTANGGAVYLGGGTMNIAGGAITENTASNNGGGAYVSDGNVIMSGGSVDNNTATSGAGGGIYVASNESNVDVIIFSGSVSGNTAKTDGGAVAVVGQEGSSNKITVTTGLNKAHFDSNKNSKLPIDHEYDGKSYSHGSCPVIQRNTSSKSGGAYYIAGSDDTKLNIYCLTEGDNKVGDGTDSLSNFMMVEGGKVLISTSDTPADDNMNDSLHGSANITASVYIVGGKVDLYGSMTNPRFNEVITVDVPKGSDAYFKDHRYNDGFYKLLYYENFKDPETGKTSGQYKEYQIAEGDTHNILGVIYNHPGYAIVGWNTDPSGNEPNEDHSENGDDIGQYAVGYPALFNGSPIGNLTLYAIWEANSYTVVFNPNIPLGETYSGTMDNQRIGYGEKATLTPNQFHRYGYKLTAWNTKADGSGDSYADKATVQNLAEENGATVELFAKWEKCDHLDNAYFTYKAVTGNAATGTPAKLIRECLCGAYSETAVLSAENSVYNEDASNPARLSNSSWKGEPLSILYMKDGVLINEEPKNAGTYTASVTAGGKTATIEYSIAKAPQAAPDKPTYTPPESGSTLVVNAVGPSTTTNAPAEYAAKYYDGDTLKTVGWSSSNQIILPVELKVYSVYVRYAETENYLASDEVMADALFFFENNISLKIKIEDGIELINLADDNNGKNLIVKVKDGYYLRNGDFTITYDPTFITIGKDKDSDRMKGQFLITGNDVTPTNPVTIEITVGGAVLTPAIKGIAVEKQVFGTVLGDDTVSISNDSAFTGYYTVANYDSAVYNGMKLDFSNSLPAGTTIILQDKTNGANTYWYYKFNSSSSEVNLTSFKKMGADNTTFSVAGSSFNYQFIVDFSQASDIAPEAFSMALTAVAKTDSGAPDCSGTVNVALSVREFHLANVSSEALVNTINASYDAGAPASKWDNRETALVLSSNSSLPPDARMKVRTANGSITEYHRNTNGNFIIPLAFTELGEVTLELVSDMFPKASANYTFVLDWYGANSVAGQGPLNGKKIDAISNLTFTKAKTPVLSVRVDGNDRLVTVGSDAKLNVTVTHKDLKDCTITAQVLRKNEDNGQYYDTAWKPKQAVTGNMTVDLAGQSAGSYCLMVIVKDGTEKVLEVPYYFIMQNPQNTMGNGSDTDSETNQTI